MQQGFPGLLRQNLRLREGRGRARQQASAPKAKLTERLSVPVTIHERLRPVSLLMTPAGEQVLDFGQEITGWVEFDCKAEKGTRIYLQYGEILQDGNFYRDNLRTAKAEFTYISDGSSAMCARISPSMASVM
mgnify:CR=1 FL=1